MLRTLTIVSRTVAAILKYFLTVAECREHRSRLVCCIHKGSPMTTIKQLSAGLIATVMFSTPAMACENCLPKRHVVKKAHTSASPTARNIDGHARIPAPHVGPFTAPPDGENCDVGDNPFIC
jgi:hypothetical protein